MKKIRIDYDGEIYERDVPTSWEEVTVKKLVEVTNADYSDCDCQGSIAVRRMSLIINVPEDVIDEIPAEQFYEINDMLSFFHDYDFVGKEKEFIEIEGEKFYLRKSLNKFKTREAIIVARLTVNPETGESINPMKVLDRLLCFLLLKKDENGEYERFKEAFLKERTEMFGQVPVADVISIVTFFFSGKQKSNQLTKGSSAKRGRKQKASSTLESKS